MTKVSRARELLERDGIAGFLSGIGRYFRYDIAKPLKDYPLGIYYCIKYSEYTAAKALFLEAIFGKNRYRRHVVADLDNPYRIHTNGYSMDVDPNDHGLSHELIVYGVRELLSTVKYEEELKKVAENVDGGVTVLEIGMNIGYYALLEAKILDKKSKIHGFEPSPSNIELAEKNVSLNGVEDRISINHAAVGKSSGSTEIQLTERSNRNYIKDGVSGSDLDNVIETQTVDMVSIDDYLSENSISPNEVNVVRLDVQGFEYSVLEGMQAILESDSPLILFIETHPNLIDQQKQNIVVDHLKEAGFELIHASDNFVPQSVKSIDELRTKSVEAILRR